MEHTSMGKVFIGVAMSLDGYIARPDMSKEHPFGVGGEQVHSQKLDVTKPGAEKCPREA
jgi:hypothetical protein